MSKPPMMILAAVDEAGLSPVEFRVLAHICRRSGESNDCWAAIKSISEVCKVNPKTARAAVRKLEEKGWIVGRKRTGQTSVLIPVTPPNPIPYPNQYPTQLDTPHPSQSDTPHPSQSDTPKGNPIREPNKGTQKDRMATPELPFKSQSFSEAWTLWQQYRKERKKPVTPTSSMMAFRKLATMTEKEATAAILFSIEKGWQGIFPDPNISKPRSTIETFKQKQQANGRNPRSFD